MRLAVTLTEENPPRLKKSAQKNFSEPGGTADLCIGRGSMKLAAPVTKYSTVVS